MKRIYTSDNAGITIKIAQKQVNYFLIGALSVILTLIDIIVNIKSGGQLSKINIDNVSLTLVCIVTYIFYIILVRTAVWLCRSLTYATKMDILVGKVVLHMGFLSLTLDTNELIVEDNLPEQSKNNILSNYLVNNPGFIILDKNDKKISLVVSQDELSKLR